MVPPQSATSQNQMVRPRQCQHAGERHPLRHEQPRLQRPEISQQFLFEEQACRRKSPYRRPRGLGLSRGRPASRRTSQPLESLAASRPRSSPPRKIRAESGNPKRTEIHKRQGKGQRKISRKIRCRGQTERRKETL